MAQPGSLKLKTIGLRRRRRNRRIKEGQEQDEEGDDREVHGAFEASPDLLFSHSANLLGQPPRCLPGSCPEKDWGRSYGGLGS